MDELLIRRPLKNTFVSRVHSERSSTQNSISTTPAETSGVILALLRYESAVTSIHKDVTLRLRRLDRVLYEEVRAVLQSNKDERHLRGGAATRQKYHPGT